MILLEFDFFILLFISVFFYYLATAKGQKYVLFIASIIFFVLAGDWKLLGILGYVFAVTYIGALCIDSLEGKKRRIAVISVVTLLFADLMLLKYVYNLGEIVVRIFSLDADVSWLAFTAPIGISYFTLSAIGYVLDVYWQTYKAEKNIVKVSLFICYFPYIVSGPILRYSEMKIQFETKHSIRYENIAYGMRRMAWGYFKKLVIADKLGMVVANVYGNYEKSGVLLICATFCYAIQLYADFSGCIDIVMGASKLYGILVPENFDAPFCSKNISEFWRRWHISLGLWFKDYVMYPLLKSNLFQVIGKWCKRRFGKKVGKKIPTFIAIFFMWMLIGLWHGGTTYYFMASAILPFCYLLGSEIIQTLSSKMTTLLKINTDCFSWKLWQCIRTFLLMCVCWVFVCAGSVSRGFGILYKMFTAFNMQDITQIATIIKNVGLSGSHFIVLMLGLIFLLLSDWFENANSSLTNILDKQNLIFRWGILWGELLIIMLFAELGQSSFIYFKF